MLFPGRCVVEFKNCITSPMVGFWPFSFIFSKALETSSLTSSVVAIATFDAYSVRIAISVSAVCFRSSRFCCTYSSLAVLAASERLRIIWTSCRSVSTGLGVLAALLTSEMRARRTSSLCRLADWFSEFVASYRSPRSAALDALPRLILCSHGIFEVRPYRCEERECGS